MQFRTACSTTGGPGVTGGGGVWFNWLEEVYPKGVVWEGARRGRTGGGPNPGKGTEPSSIGGGI